jgi:serine/threonine protein kinase/streptogramin lyase
VYNCPVSGDPRIGTELAGYRIESLLGRGGMSVVYLAEHRGLGRKVALKLIAPELSRDDAFRQRFVRESRLAASLDHPNVVPIFEAGEAEGVLFIAMRYVRGTDLRTVIQRDGSLTMERTVHLTDQIAGALDEAHAEGLIHRDVKSANVLVTPAREEGAEHVHLTDFGLTKQALSGSGLTGTGQFMGSIDYAAPEQFQGKPLDRRTDVYALGCVVYECLTGRPPFHRESEAAVLYAHLNEPAPKVTDVREDVPPAVDGVVSRAMAKDPAGRFDRAGALAAALRASAPTRQGGRLDLPSPTTTPPRRAAEPRPVRRRAALVMAGTGALAIVVLAIVLLSVGGGGSPGNSPSPPGASAPRLVPLGRGAVRIDPVTHEPGKAIRLPGGSFWIPTIAVGEGAVWATSLSGLSHVDPGTGAVETTIPNPPGVAPGWVVFAAHDVWAGYTNNATNVSTEVARVDPATDEIIKRISLRYSSPAPSVVALAAAGGFVWASNGLPSITRIDPATNHTAGTIDLPGTPLDMDTASGSLWIIYSDVDELTRVDPRTGRILAHIPLQNSATALATGPEAVWVISNVEGIATEVDPTTTEVIDNVAVGGNPSDLGIGEDGTLWITMGSGEVVHYDPTIRRPIAIIRFDGHLDHIAVVPDGVWVVSRS